MHLATWTKDKTYQYVLINENNEGKYSEMFTYNVVVKKLTYAESDLKEVTEKIYKNPQALTNYLIDTFSREGDWVLVLFSGSGKISDITYESIFQVLLFFYS